MTEFINDNHTQNNSKQWESHEISIQNLRNRVNLVDNKSRAKNILINNVEEKSTENAIQLITKVNQIMHDMDDTIHVTRAYRIGQTNKSKSRPIIAYLETEKQKYAADKLTGSNAQKKFKMRLSVKISFIISKSLDRYSSQNIRKWSNNTDPFASGKRN